MAFVMIGNGPSGIDIAVDISKTAEIVYVCARSWDNVLASPSQSFESHINVIPCANIKSCTGKGKLELTVSLGSFPFHNNCLSNPRMAQH